MEFRCPIYCDVFSTLYQMGYQARLKGVSGFKIEKYPVVWQNVCHYVIRFLSVRTGGTDNMGKPLIDIFWSIFTGNRVNYVHILWRIFFNTFAKVP